MSGSGSVGGDWLQPRKISPPRKTAFWPELSASLKPEGGPEITGWVFFSKSGFMEECSVLLENGKLKI